MLCISKMVLQYSSKIGRNMLCRKGSRNIDAGTVPVNLNVYDLTPINGYAYWFGLGVYHSGVQGQWCPVFFFHEFQFCLKLVWYISGQIYVSVSLLCSEFRSLNTKPKRDFFFLVLCSTGFGHFSLLLMFCLDNEKVQEQITYIEFQIFCEVGSMETNTKNQTKEEKKKILPLFFSVTFSVNKQKKYLFSIVFECFEDSSVCFLSGFLLACNFVRCVC